MSHDGSPDSPQRERHDRSVFRRHLTKAERQALTFGGAIVGLLSGVAQFLASYVQSGIELLGISAAVVMAGLALTLGLMRGWRAGHRKFTLSINLMAAAAVVLILVGGIGGAIGRGVGVWARPSPSDSAWPSPFKSAQPSSSDPACTPSEGSGVVQPSPPKARRLSFCQVLINKGQPIAGGGFTLEGEVLGPTTERQNLVLFVRIDPTTCDANGKPGAPGRFLVDGVKFYEVDGRWSYRDDFGGYAAGVTFGRVFEFATASPAVVRGIMGRRDEWKDNGLTGEMLNEVSFLARFDVPPGQTPGQRSCSG